MRRIRWAALAPIALALPFAFACSADASRDADPLHPAPDGDAGADDARTSEAGARDGAVPQGAPDDAGSRGGRQNGGPALAKWQYFRVLTLDTTAAGASLSTAVPKYPVAITLDAAHFDFAQMKRSDGADLRF